MDLSLKSGEKAVVTLTSDSGISEIDIDGAWAGTDELNKDGFPPTIIHQVIRENKTRRIGIRVPSSESIGSVNVSASLSVFDSGSMKISNAENGSILIPPGGMAIVEGKSIQRSSAEPVVLIHQPEPDSGRITFFNPGSEPAGASWSSATGPVTLPDRIPVKNGSGPKIFLGPGLSQIFTFSIAESLHTGISIQSTGGHIQGGLMDANGVEIATGLVINKRLEPGDYTLLIQNPMEGSPAMIQPFFVLTTPDQLTRFGKEE